MFSSMKRICQFFGSTAAMTRSPCGGMKACTPSVRPYEYSNVPNEGVYRGKTHKILRAGQTPSFCICPPIDAFTTPDNPCPPGSPGSTRSNHRGRIWHLTVIPAVAGERELG